MHQTKSYLVEAASPAAAAGTGVWGWTKTRQHLAVPYSNGGASSFLFVANQSPLSKSFMDSLSGRSIISIKTSVSLVRHVFSWHCSSTWLACCHCAVPKTFEKLTRFGSSTSLPKGALMKGEGEIWRVKMICHPKSGFGTASLSFWSNEITTCSLLDF